MGTASNQPPLPTLDAFLESLRSLLLEQDARAAWVFGSHARGTADAWSDIDVIIVAPTERPPVERFRDYLPAIMEAGVGVDLFVYTPEEFQRMNDEERPLLVSALQDARPVHEDRTADALGAPFEAFSGDQAAEALERAAAFVALAAERVRDPQTR